MTRDPPVRPKKGDPFNHVLFIIAFGNNTQYFAIYEVTHQKMSISSWKGTAR